MLICSLHRCLLSGLCHLQTKQDSMLIYTNTPTHTCIHRETWSAMAIRDWLHWISGLLHQNATRQSPRHTHTQLCAQRQGFPGHTITNTHTRARTHMNRWLSRHLPMHRAQTAHPKSHACTQNWPQHASIGGDLLTEVDRREEICLAKGLNGLICGQQPTWRITSKTTHTRPAACPFLPSPNAALTVL